MRILTQTSLYACFRLGQGWGVRNPTLSDGLKLDSKHVLHTERRQEKVSTPLEHNCLPQANRCGAKIHKTLQDSITSADLPLLLTARFFAAHHTDKHHSLWPTKQSIRLFASQVAHKSAYRYIVS